MGSIGSGSTGHEIERVTGYQAELLENRNGKQDRIVLETDKSGYTRFVPAIVLARGTKTFTFIRLDCPFKAMKKKFFAGNLRHLDFNPRDLLERTFDSGMGHLRSIGQLFIIWQRETLTQIIGKLVSGDASESDRLAITYALGGGSGSSFVPNLLEILYDVTHEHGRLIKKEIHLLGISNTVAGQRSLTQVELLNEAAAAREISAIISGGACFPQASTRDWGTPAAFDGDTSLWFFHNPGDRGDDPCTFTSTLASIKFLAFEEPATSASLHRDGADKRTDFSDHKPACCSAGVSRVFVPDQEKERYIQARFCEDVLSEALMDMEGSNSQARAFIRKNGLADDGRNPGLSSVIINRAFQGKNPIRDKIFTRHPSSGLTVHGHLQSVKNHGDRVKRDLQPDLARIAGAADDLENEIPGILRDRMAQLALHSSPGSVRSVARMVQSILAEMSSSLDSAITSRLAQSDQSNRLCSDICDKAVEHSRKSFWTKHSDIREYMSLPKQLWEAKSQQLHHSAVAEIYKSTLQVQQSIENNTAGLVDEVQQSCECLETTRDYFAEQAAILRATGMSHRGYGLCLMAPDTFEVDYQHSGLIDRYGANASSLIRALLSKALKDGSGPLDRPTIVKALEEYAQANIACPNTNIEEVLEKRQDVEDILRRSLRQARPLISKDPTHKPVHEILIVRTPRGQDSMFASKIEKLTCELQITDQPTFVSGPSNEITFFHVETGIPLSATLPLLRAEKAYEQSERNAQYQAHRMPIFWFLPSPVRDCTTSESLQTFVMGWIAGLIHESGSEWFFETQAGTRTLIPNLTSESVHSVLSDYRRAVQARSWFICKTLEHGFQWASDRLKELSQVRGLGQGIWPKVILDFHTDLTQIAELHHQEVL